MNFALWDIQFCGIPKYKYTSQSNSKHPKPIRSLKFLKYVESFTPDFKTEKLGITLLDL